MKVWRNAKEKVMTISKQNSHEEVIFGGENHVINVLKTLISVFPILRKRKMKGFVRVNSVLEKSNVLSAKKTDNRGGRSNLKKRFHISEPAYAQSANFYGNSTLSVGPCICGKSQTTKKKLCLISLIAQIGKEFSNWVSSHYPNKEQQINFYL